MVFDAPTYPVSLVLSGRPCLVVGGGRVAARKLEGLLTSGAVVTVVAPEVAPEIVALPVTVHQRPYRPGEAAEYVLVIAATGDPSVDHLVAADAREAHVPVNVADDPAACTVILPAVARHGRVSVAVSTDGASPAVARWGRDRISAAFGRELEHLAEIVGRARARVRGESGSSEGRDWESLIEAVHRASSTAGPEEAEKIAHRWTSRWLGEHAPPPKDA